LLDQWDRRYALNSSGPCEPDTERDGTNAGQGYQQPSPDSTRSKATARRKTHVTVLCAVAKTDHRPPVAAVTSPGRLLPPECGDGVIVGRGVPHQPVRQGEDPLRHAQGQREAAAPGAKVRLGQPDRVVGFQPHINQL
jgi:hypothetical protein